MKPSSFYKNYYSQYNIKLKSRVKLHKEKSNAFVNHTFRMFYTDRTWNIANKTMVI